MDAKSKGYLERRRCQDDDQIYTYEEIEIEMEMEIEHRAWSRDHRA